MMNNTPHHIIYILLLLLGAASPALAQTIKGNVYGGGQLGKVAGNTNVTIESGSVTTGTSGGSNVFGGGYQAEVAGNTAIAINGGEAGNVYGGGEAADIVVGAAETGNTVVSMNGGTIHHSVYGGGLGNTTNVATSTTVTANGGTVTEDVYGGSGFGKVGATAVTINNNATVKRDVFGGGFGSITPNNYEADVNGNASVTINKGASISGNVYGGNNTNGSPKGTVTVLVDGPVDATEKESTPLELKDVFGGGKNAATLSSAAPAVTIQGCATEVKRVFGGGDAASVPATNVIIKGGHIGQAFAGGNGEVVAAHVGYAANGTTPYASGTGNASMSIQGGVVGDAFGGSNTAGNIRGTVEVEVDKADDACDLAITNLFGGGNKANGKAATIAIACTGNGKIENVFGGANQANVEGDITLNITGGNIGNIFGGNNQSGIINGAIAVNINWGSDDCGIKHIDNVYGGGNLAPYTTPGGKAHPTITLTNGTVSNNVYGGGLGEAAVVTGNPIVNLIGGAVTNNIFGGGDAAPVTGNPQVNANYGSVKDIFAGGRGSTAVVTGNPKAYINYIAEDPETHEALTLTINDVYGGGDAANVVGTGKVQLDKGTVANIYGGGNAADVTNTDVVINGGTTTMAFAGGHGDKTAEPQKEANVTGDAHLTIHGGTVAKAFAGSNSKGTITGSQLVTIVKDANALAELHVAEVYGGGNQADGKAGTFDIGCTGSDSEGIGDLFGGAREANITGNIAFIIEGGKIDRIFGGNNVSGNVAGSITVNIAENTTKYDCGLHAGYVYGGGQDAAYTPTTPGAYPAVNIQKGSVEHDVFGGGLGATAVVTSNPTVTISGGSVGNNVFGGGSLAETDGNPTVNVCGGTVTHDVYGGGALADVTGNTTVNLTGGAVGGAYGGALGSDVVAAKVYGDTYVHLDGSKVTETGIFGANNLNGTPTGHVKVHVTRTTPRDGEDYDVPAVYGGGNLSAYVPTDADDYAEVLIENCDNSIAYVYGGGNAAPVPATDVKIYGANAIDNAFAGGNGAGQSTDPSGDNYNPGADIGYSDYTRDEEHKYGAGTASITVYGGTVHNVFGGSNTLGYIAGGASVNVTQPDNDDPYDHDCTLNIGKVFGGGNEADMNCDIEMTCGCTEGVELLYAGANNADVDGNITLNILSGTYGQVFCGNNQGGAVKGSLTLNIDETGCWPVMIGELYGCGNDAAYSVYGYDNEGNCIASGEKLYEDPVINIYSCTGIGRIFGGGKGSGATVYGNPTVNINTIKGRFAGQDVTPLYILDANCKRIENNNALTTIEDNVGKIGTVYGGGNQAAVHGNTTVNIGTLATNKHLNAAPEAPNETVSVRITDNVFGGGKTAEVTGKATVTIGKDQQ